MSIDMEREVRSYAEFLDEILPAITADDVRSATPLESLGSTTTVRSVPRWYRRPVAVFAAAVVVTILAIVPVVFLGMMDDRSPDVVDAATTTTATAATTTLPTQQTSTTIAASPSSVPVVVVPPSASWERIVDESLALGEIWAMASNDTVVVAVGAAPDSSDASTLQGSYTNGVVWVSADGMSWDRIDDYDVFGGDEFQVLWDVTAGPLGIIATGQDGVDAALWFSPDGYAWQKVFVHDLGTPGEADDLTVAAASPGWIAVRDTDDAAHVVFTSETGVEWVRVDDATDADELAALVEAAQGPDPVTEPPLLGTSWDYAWDDGALIAAGRHTVAAVWLSEDSGTSWHRVDPEQAAFDGYPWPQTLAVTTFGTKIIVGGNAEPDAAIWIGTWNES